jgi:hypothetical protein
MGRPTVYMQRGRTEKAVRGRQIRKWDVKNSIREPLSCVGEDFERL